MPMVSSLLVEVRGPGKAPSGHKDLKPLTDAQSTKTHQLLMSLEGEYPATVDSIHQW